MKNRRVSGIAKISKQSAVDLVMEQMKTLIKDGIWEVGQRIPSESDLASMFDVNRLTIRLALQKLNTFGLVQTRVGEGTFVTEFNFIDYVTQISDFYNQDMDIFDDIADFREAVELRCCSLAMKRATKDELAELDSILTELEQVQVLMDKSLSNKNIIEQSFLESVDLDLKFHAYICTIAKNSLLISSFAMAKDAIYQHLLMIVRKRLLLRLEKIKQGDIVKVNLHREIYNAIIENNFEKCQKAYLDMLNQRVNPYEF